MREQRGNISNVITQNMYLNTNGEKREVLVTVENGTDFTGRSS